MTFNAASGTAQVITDGIFVELVLKIRPLVNKIDVNSQNYIQKLLNIKIRLLKSQSYILRRLRLFRKDIGRKSEGKIRGRIFAVMLPLITQLEKEIASPKKLPDVWLENLYNTVDHICLFRKITFNEIINSTSKEADLCHHYGLNY